MTTETVTTIIISSIAAIVFILFLRYAYQQYILFRLKLGNKLFEIIAHIRQFYKRLRTLQQKGEGFTKHKEEPYIGPTRFFSAALRQAIKNLVFSSDERLRLINSISRNSSNYPNIPIINTLFIHYKWFILNKEIKRLDLILSEDISDIKLVQNAFEQLRNLPWKIALRAREFKKQNDQSKSILEDLYRVGIHGQTIDIAKSREAKIESNLDNIPNNIYRQTRQEVLSIPDSAHLTIFIHKILETINFQCTQLNEELRYWEKVYLDSSQTVEKSIKIIKDTYKISKNTPIPLDISPEKTILFELTNKLRVIRVRYRAPTIEDLEPIIALANDLSMEGYSLRKKLIDAKNDFLNLETNVSILDEKIKQAQRDLYYHSRRPVYPILWNETKKNIEELVVRKDGIAPIDANRTIEQLSIDIEQTDQLSTQINAVEKTISDITSQAHEIRTSWDYIKQIINGDWKTAADQLIIDINQYAPENWDERILTLRGDVDVLFRQAKEDIPVDTSYKLAEEGVAKLLSETSSMITLLNELEKRKSWISNRLLEVKRAQLIAQKIIDDNLPTAQLVVSEAEIESLRLQSGDELIQLAIDGEMLQNEVNQSKIGNIFEKAEKAQWWASELMSKGQNLIKDLEQITNDLQINLEDKINEIKQYARKIQDPIVDEAERFRPVNVYSYDIPSIDVLSINTVYQHIRYLVNDYKKVYLCESNFESRIAPLRDEFSKVLDLQDDAEKKLRQAQDKFDRLWPPVDEELDLTEEIGLLENARDAFIEVKSHRRDLNNLEREYFEVGIMFKDVSQKLNRKMKIDNDKIIRHEGLEQEARERLQRQVDKSLHGIDYESAQAYREILLQKGEIFFNNIKTRYRKKTLTSFDIALALNALFREQNTIIDVRTQNIQMGNIVLSDGSTISLNQSL